MDKYLAEEWSGVESELMRTPVGSEWVDMYYYMLIIHVLVMREHGQVLGRRMEWCGE